jgi:hypothetical protein
MIEVGWLESVHAITRAVASTPIKTLFGSMFFMVFKPHHRSRLLGSKKAAEATMVLGRHLGWWRSIGANQGGGRPAESN